MGRNRLIILHYFLIWTILWLMYLIIFYLSINHVRDIYPLFDLVFERRQDRQTCSPHRVFSKKSIVITYFEVNFWYILAVSNFVYSFRGLHIDKCSIGMVIQMFFFKFGDALQTRFRFSFMWCLSNKGYSLSFLFLRRISFGTSFSEKKGELK